MLVSSNVSLVNRCCKFHGKKTTITNELSGLCVYRLLGYGSWTFRIIFLTGRCDLCSLIITCGCFGIFDKYILCFDAWCHHFIGLHTVSIKSAFVQSSSNSILRNGACVRIHIMHFLLLVLLLCLNPVFGCPMLDDAYGNITEDQIVQEGSSYKITCYLFPNYVEKHNITSDQLTLVSKRKTLKPTIIDEYSIEYAVESASVNDSGFYQCLVPKPGYQRPQLVCATTVTVGYPPGNVTDFSCISYDYTELNCSWTIPDNPVRTSYKLFDYLQGIEVFSRECLKGYPSKDFQTSCVYELNTKPPYLQGPKILNFIVYGNNSLGLSKQRFRINHYEIIKPGLPTFVHFTDVIFVTTENGNSHVLIDNLVPNTNYAFEIRCRLNVKGDKFLWGDPKNITEITHSDVPYLAPVIESSAFDYQIISANRTISLYWKPVPSQFENGDNFHYIIKYHEYFVPTRTARQTSKKPGPSYFVGNKTSHSFSHLDPGTAYLFKIIAVNDVGKSSNESATIVVDKRKKKKVMLHGPKDITVISYGRGNYDISWKTPDVRYSNFILYWCETHPSAPEVKCGRRHLQWIPIVNKTFHKLLLSNQDSIYQFAVATIHDQQTSGMYWAACTAVFGRNCTYQKIINCTVDGKGPIGWPHVIVSNTTSTEYILSSLKPFTCYGAYIRVRTDGGWGMSSDYAYESTMPSAPGDAPTKVHAVVEDASIKVSFDPTISKWPNNTIYNLL
ncbi:cytokine receptor [Caerostris extrusa]|uniref:Cytokine receptor n=1 Tax=Caerostris extrusa TaxID=172846 RepID=A0AAV4VQL5_CAEEX|nr:cytokine receptor [Caerostris extrusa]